MKKRSLLISLFAALSFSIANADVVIDATTFPDLNFRTWLKKQTYGEDGLLTADEIKSVTSMSLTRLYIENLQGIEYFTSLTELSCGENLLTSLDVSKNTLLTGLDCYSNQLTSLDVSKNTLLKSLICFRNNITSIDVSQNIYLERFWCYENKLSSLDVSKNTKLVSLDCHGNQLTTLDLSNNYMLDVVKCYQNNINGTGMETLVASLPTEYSIEFDVIYNKDEQNLMSRSQVASAKEKGWTPKYYDGSQWQEYEGYDPSVGDILIDSQVFPDENFCNWIKKQTYGADGILSKKDISGVTTMGLGNNNIASLQGIELFTALTTLRCNSNQLTTLDVSKNKKLKTLACYCNQIHDEGMEALLESLPTVSGGELRVIYNNNEQNIITKAQVAYAKERGWTSKKYDGSDWVDYEGYDPTPEGVVINATNFPDLNFRTWLKKQTYGEDGLLTADEIKSVTSMSLTRLYIENLQGIEYFTSLTELSCGENLLTSLDVSKNTLLTGLDCYSNQLTSLDVSKNTLLKSLICFRNNITSIDVSQNIYLERFWCYENKLSSLDVSKNTKLVSLDCHGNQLTTLDLSNNYMLDVVKCYQNNINGAGMEALVASLPTEYSIEFDVIYNKDEQNLMSRSQVASAKEKGWTPKYFDGTYWKEYTGYDPAPENIAINSTNFPDENFRSYLLARTYGADGMLSKEEIEMVKELSVSVRSINNLKGIEFFTSLKSLICYSNQLTSLDVSKNTALTYLSCSSNQLTSLNVSGCTSLTRLDCSLNQLTSLDLSGCTSLTQLDCSSNQLTSLDVSKNTELTDLDCKYNQLTALDVSGCTSLTKFYCYSNQLTSLDVSGCTLLTNLECSSNQLTSLDVSKNTALLYMTCTSNQLTSLDVSKNNALKKLNCQFNQLTMLNVNGCTSMTTLQCYNNRIKGAAMDAFVESLPRIESCVIYVINNDDEHNRMSTTQVTAAKAKGWLPYYNTNAGWHPYAGSQPLPEGVEIDDINFPDEKFRSYLLSQSYGQDGVLTKQEIANVTSMKVVNLGIKNLKGIECFTELTKLECNDNKIGSLDLSKNKKLTTLSCYNNQISSLNLHGCFKLVSVYIYQNRIYGEAMDDFIASLEYVSGLNMYVLYNKNEQNEMTTKQVKAANKKGWRINYYNGKQWLTYIGYDQTVANEVIAKIDAIGTVEYTDACKNRIEQARAAYDALTDYQKTLVTSEKLNVLTSAEAEYERLKEIATDIVITNNDDVDNSAPWYTISGVLLSGKPTEKGLYIHAGRIIIVK